MNLPKLTTKQQEILKLLYRYRFLNRIQIQQLMRHKDYKTINLWLKDLREKQYVTWIYSTHFLEKTKPAIYYLGINGIRYLRQQATIDEAGEEYYAYPTEELRKRYRDKDRSESFRTRSLLIADCCINLIAKTSQDVRYGFYTQADYADPDHAYHFLTGGDLASPSQLGPQLCIVKKAGRSKPVHCLLEIFDATLPRYRMRTRFKQYMTFLTEGDWEDETEHRTLPTILLVLPRLADLIYAKRKIKKLLDDLWDDDEKRRAHIRLTTAEQLQKHGITGGIWEEGRRVYGV